MYKVELELTPAEMLAIGYCIGAGQKEAIERGEEGMKAAIVSLFGKIHTANAKAGGPQLKEPVDPTRFVEI